MQAKQQWYQANQINMSREDEQVYLEYCAEAMFRIHILELRLNRSVHFPENTLFYYCFFFCNILHTSSTDTKRSRRFNTKKWNRSFGTMSDSTCHDPAQACTLTLIIMPTSFFSEY